jgi:hypothetical protein
MLKLMSRQEKMKQVEDAQKQLLSGEIVTVIDASYSAHSLAIGDFRILDMVEKNVWRDGMNWTWKGPGKIRMNGRVYAPGEATEEIDMDWS